MTNLESNLTTVTEFFLLGFHVSQVLRISLFSLLLLITCCTLCGNLLIITLVSTSRNLHTPMYFFISQLSITDILLTIDIAPIMLNIVLNNGGTITFIGCITQFFFFSFSEIFECLLLTVMSYDRYVAICNPLRYTSIITHEYCAKLVIVCWLVTLLIVVCDSLPILKLKFCQRTIIDHFFCDLVPLMDVACSGTQLVQLEVSILGPPAFFIPVIIITVSYINIIITILKIPTNMNRQKAFSTCSSHLAVVSIFYCSLFSVYVFPTKGKTLTISKALSLLYTIFTPFINPIIYSLRNKDIMKAVREEIIEKSLWFPQL
ncbi:olfactory receptor 1500-like [Anomaloglossus baeobatrachus]|uniref:olfactory receptor 1500-like n=1 Tax=Anomaloglossus baeobatrachus TaxID=238106 RepID=UPI003F4F984B